VADLDQAGAFVRALLAAGGRLGQLTPHRQSLEALLMSEVERADAGEEASP
jgi:hypothetical protein